MSIRPSFNLLDSVLQEVCSCSCFHTILIGFFFCLMRNQFPINRDDTIGGALLPRQWDQNYLLKELNCLTAPSIAFDHKSLNLRIYKKPKFLSLPQKGIFWKNALQDSFLLKKFALRKYPQLCWKIKGGEVTGPSNIENMSFLHFSGARK